MKVRFLFAVSLCFAVLCPASIAGSMTIPGSDLTVRLGSVTGEVGDRLSVTVYLERGVDYAGEFPAAIDFRIEYDENAVRPVPGGNGVLTKTSIELDEFYDKVLVAGSPIDGRFTVIVFGGQSAIDTFDPDTLEQVNPFPMGEIFFEFVEDGTPETELRITNFSAATPSASPIDGIVLIDGFISREGDVDGDGIFDSIEDSFPDGDDDGTPNREDMDSDNDGIPDEDEYDSDGAADSELNDADQDGTPDFLDTDSDNDEIPDSEEYNDTLADAGLLDADMDGTLNYRDTDSDNNGIDDIDEPAGDLDEDGEPDFLDLDDDGDGLTDTLEIENGFNHRAADSDNNGIDDFDDDADGDGLTNGQELLDFFSDPRDPEDPPSDVYVSAATGSDSNPGTEGAPFATIAHAMSVIVGNESREGHVFLFEEEFTEPVDFETNITIGTRPAAVKGDLGRAAFVVLDTLAAPLLRFDSEDDGAGLRDVDIIVESNVPQSMELISIDNADVRIENVAIVGDLVSGTTGIAIYGADSSDTEILDCTIIETEIGIYVSDSAAKIARTLFEDIFGAAVVIEPGAESGSKGVELVPSLGDAADLESTGLNRFRMASGLFIDSAATTEVSARFNDWGVDSEDLVRARIMSTKGTSSAAIEPIVAQRISSDTLVLRVVDEDAEDPLTADIDNAEVSVQNGEVIRDASSLLFLVYGWARPTAVIRAEATFSKTLQATLNVPPYFHTLALESTTTAAGPADVNGDVQVNSVDIQIVINSILGVPGQGAAVPDINRDGMTNAQDVQLVINWVLGIPTR